MKTWQVSFDLQRQHQRGFESIYTLLNSVRKDDSLRILGKDTSLHLKYKWRLLACFAVCICVGCKKKKKFHRCVLQ